MSTQPGKITELFPTEITRVLFLTRIVSLQMPLEIASRMGLVLAKVTGVKGGFTRWVFRIHVSSEMISRWEFHVTIFARIIFHIVVYIPDVVI